MDKDRMTRPHDSFVHHHLFVDRIKPRMATDSRKVFLTHLEGIMIQKQLEKTVEDYYKSPIVGGGRVDLLKRMLELLKHRSFSSVLYSKRCPHCKGSLYLAEVDKGSAFVCEKCGETEELFMRHVCLSSLYLS